MSDNGKKETILIKVCLNNGSIELDINTEVNIALITHALFLANMEIQEVIVRKEYEKAQKEQSNIITANNAINRVRKG